MRYNLLITRLENCEVVFDKWFNSLSEAIELFIIIQQNIEVGYWLHIVNENNFIIREYEKINGEIL